MLLLLTKLVALTFAAVIISKSYLSYRQGRESWVVSLFWTLTWLAIVGVSFYPEEVSKQLGRSKLGVGSLLGIGLMSLYFVIYRVYVKADRVERQLSKLVREVSIKEISSKPRNKTKKRPKKK